MDCPRCKIPLSTKNVQDMKVSFDVDFCETCGGTWFDQGELSQIDKVVEPTFLEIRKIPRKKEQMLNLTCPSCGPQQIMEKMEHERDSKVIIDFCPSCKGIWLDKGELEAIQKENWLITVGRIHRWLLGA